MEGGGQNFSARLLRGGGKILVQRDLKALLKHLEIPLKIFAAADHYQYNTTNYANIPNVKGHFVMMCNTDNTKMVSSKCIDINALGAKF